MYQIVAHVKPKKDSKYYKNVLGAYVTCFINYKEIDGAVVLTKHYIENEGWEEIELEDEYFIINSIEDMVDCYKQYYKEVFEYGYSLIFNTYNKIEEDD
ncbi:hypothetical protein [Flammeovirga sp. SJP92]|uniref:hypothetical protein n=1 Tax=Flammeovirga sp. SJP92 TaxID=1775430 RepID=UPI0007876D50|nr:hypothetical protein [Flammeovirga sp. SJP92]KXX70405.1 hypothetical protein AVL50_32500 [Flammeovirga sp. SJP92]KXX70883.1 hypothetical protein AVL50_10955 [Flammeovirga sp. SJP92]